MRASLCAFSSLVHFLGFKLKCECSGPNRKFMLEGVRQALRGRVVQHSHFTTSVFDDAEDTDHQSTTPHQVFKETLTQQKRRYVVYSFEV